MRISFCKVEALTAEESASLAILNTAVYPPEVVANWPGNAIEWARTQWRVIGWDHQGRAVSHVGVIIRDGMAGDAAAMIGGIGGVMTHPNARRQGWAAKCIAMAVEFFSMESVDFALLVCEPELVPVYERIGWQLYPDRLLVTQHGKRCQFTFNLPMVKPICRPVPTSGAIDLLGPPW
jgi:hypothetical protein